MFEKVCFIGLGLIGASLAQAMRDKKLAKSIVAVSRSQATIDKGINYGLLDAGFDDAALAVQGADLVVIATPVQAVKKIFEKIKPFITDNTIIMDVGSTARYLVRICPKVLCPPIRLPAQKNQGLMRVMPNYLITIKSS